MEARLFKKLPTSTQSILPLQCSQKRTEATVKAVTLHATKTLGGRGYSSYSFSTSALDGGEWSALRPGRALDPGKGPPVSTGQEAGWAPKSVWTQRLEEKSFRLCRWSNLDRSVVKPLARHYTDWATRLTQKRTTLHYPEKLKPSSLVYVYCLSFILLLPSTTSSVSIAKPLK
jgi:hypothetical protein